jgi:hypothetical protein
MAWWCNRITMVLLVATLGCGGSDPAMAGDSSSGDDASSAATTGDCATPIAALLVRITDEGGAAVGGQVSYSIAGGEFAPASCAMLGRCTVAQGYGQSITVRVESMGCSYELQTFGAADRCSLDAPELAFTVYPNCTGDPSTGSAGSSGSSDSSSDGADTSSSSGGGDGSSSDGSSSDGSSTDGASSDGASSDGSSSTAPE